MNTITSSVFKGAGVSLVVAIPLWWLPAFLQQDIAGFWLAVMTLPSIMLGGFVAARKALRPILAGMLTGLLVAFVIVTFALTTGELWTVPVLTICGGMVAALGAYIAVLAGQATARK